MRDFDARAATEELRFDGAAGAARGLGAGVATLAGIEVELSEVRMTRTAQGDWDGARSGDPLASSRDR